MNAPCSDIQIEDGESSYCEFDEIRNDPPCYKQLSNAHLNTGTGRDHVSPGAVEWLSDKIITSVQN